MNANENLTLLLLHRKVAKYSCLTRISSFKADVQLQGSFERYDALFALPTTSSEKTGQIVDGTFRRLRRDVS